MLVGIIDCTNVVKFILYVGPVRPSLEIRITVTYCASSFVGRQSQSRNCYENIKFENIQGFLRTSREHFHDVESVPIQFSDVRKI